jgi:hypothetical protein
MEAGSVWQGSRPASSDANDGRLQTGVTVRKVGEKEQSLPPPGMSLRRGWIKDVPPGTVLETETVGVFEIEYTDPSSQLPDPDAPRRGEPRRGLSRKVVTAIGVDSALSAILRAEAAERFSE